jgi:hypothetical protein
MVSERNLVDEAVTALANILREPGWKDYNGVWLFDLGPSREGPSVRYEEGDDIATLDLDGGYISLRIEELEVAANLIRRINAACAAREAA